MHALQTRGLGTGFLALLTVALVSDIGTRSSAQVVVEDDEPAVVTTVEEEAVVAGDDAPASWPPTVVEPREVEGQRCFSRQSSDAFVDPDQRMSLEAKYCFDLSSLEPPKFGNLTHGHSASGELQISAAKGAKLSDLAGSLPLVVPPTSDESPLAVEWLDYGSRRPPKLLALLLSPSGDDDAQLYVVRGQSDASTFAAKNVAASRAIPRGELPHDRALGPLLDVWDRPASLGPGTSFFGRVIALVKQVDGRYAIDFLGEALHEDSDCRLWLGPTDQAWGRPIGIEFLEIPILKEADRIVDTPVLAVQFENASGERRTIGLDFPVCATPALVQLRRLSSGLASGASKTAAPPDLAKLLGEDVVDELSRRLVDGQYR